MIAEAKCVLDLHPVYISQVREYKRIFRAKHAIIFIDGLFTSISGNVRDSIEKSHIGIHRMYYW